jgi:hypothetical protein
VGTPASSLIKRRHRNFPAEFPKLAFGEKQMEIDNFVFGLNGHPIIKLADGRITLLSMRPFQ